MIGRIAGIVLHKAPDHVMIDVRGVGYIVQVSERTSALLPPVGQAAALFTDLQVREDMMQLFGFTSMVEKEWHRLLTSVQGVGAKVSLAILGALGPEALGRVIALGDTTAIRKAPGVGPKLAARILMELKDKAPAIMALAGASAQIDAFDEVIETPSKAQAAPVSAPAQAVGSGSAKAQADAMSALINLGYGPSEAATAIAAAASAAPDLGTSALIRAALKALAPQE